MQGNWNRYGLGIIGIFGAVLIILVSILLDKQFNKVNETPLPAYIVLKSEDRSSETRSRLQVYIFAPSISNAKDRAQLVMLAAKQIQKSHLSEKPEWPNYQHVTVILEAFPNTSGPSLPLALAEYSPDGLGKQGKINDQPKNLTTWNVSSSHLNVDLQNPSNIRSLKGSLKTYLKK